MGTIGIISTPRRTFGAPSPRFAQIPDEDLPPPHVRVNEIKEISTQKASVVVVGVRLVFKNYSNTKRTPQATASDAWAKILVSG